MIWNKITKKQDFRNKIEKECWALWVDQAGIWERDYPHAQYVADAINRQIAAFNEYVNEKRKGPVGHGITYSAYLPTVNADTVYVKREDDQSEMLIIQTNTKPQ